MRAGREETLKSFLIRYEEMLDPQRPVAHEIPTRILGYGEISTVLAIGERNSSGGKNQSGIDIGGGLAVKRMPMFNSREEAENYRRLFFESIESLRERVGIDVVENSLIQVEPEEYARGREKGKPIVMYIIQRRLESDSIGNRIIHIVAPKEVERLVAAVVEETRKVFEFNRRNRGSYEIGFDGQISNWVVRNYQVGSGRLPEKPQLAYFDTSSPLLRKNGVEQLDPELFLRSAPSFMVWIIRLLFLKDVLTRYYDFRKVLIDLLANFYKEKLGHLVPELVEVVNGVIEKPVSNAAEDKPKRASLQAPDDTEPLRVVPITVKEVESYYREDAMIWRLYLAFRKTDRFLKNFLKLNYPYILPEKIER